MSDNNFQKKWDYIFDNLSPKAKQDRFDRLKKIKGEKFKLTNVPQIETKKIKVEYSKEFSDELFKIHQEEFSFGDQLVEMMNK